MASISCCPLNPKSLYEILCATGSNRKIVNGTTANDGWLVTSCTSAAEPQAARICALLKEVQLGLSPDLIKAIRKGKSATGQPAGEGYDGATGAGLIDAHGAYRLARSITPRNLSALPSPR